MSSTPLGKVTLGDDRRGCQEGCDSAGAVPSERCAGPDRSTPSPAERNRKVQFIYAGDTGHVDRVSAWSCDGDMSGNPCPVAGPGTPRRRSGSSAGSSTPDTWQVARVQYRRHHALCFYNASRPARLDRRPRTGTGPLRLHRRCAHQDSGTLWSTTGSRSTPSPASARYRIWSRPRSATRAASVSSFTLSAPDGVTSSLRPAKLYNYNANETLIDVAGLDLSAAPAGAHAGRVTYDAGWRATSSKTPLGLDF